MDEKTIASRIAQNRDFMKRSFGREAVVSDQQKLLPQPPLVKEAQGGKQIPLTRDFSQVVTEHDYVKLLEERVSNRFYADTPMTLDQLAFLLWSTQGVRAIRGKNYAALRPVPSAGARHPFETYLAVSRVEGLAPGIYHYLPMEHALELVKEQQGMAEEIAACACNQKWAAKAAVAFFYTCVAYRGEWRYSVNAHRVMLMDVGHIMQNLYLSAQAVGCGTCAVAAIQQRRTDALLGVDGKEEYTVYMAPVGVRDESRNATGTQKLYADV